MTTPNMKSVLLSTILILSLSSQAQSLYFPPTTGSDWESIAPADLGWCIDKIDNLYGFLEEKNTKAFIVLKDGKIVLEKYFDDHDVNKLWYWASAGKTLTCFLTGLAESEDLLALDDPQCPAALPNNVAWARLHFVRAGEKSAGRTVA